jgi:hypothetical protein
MERPRRLALKVGVLLLAAWAALPAAAEKKPPKDPWKLLLFRFEFDNDSLLGSDDAFTAGWSAQLHSPLHDTWQHGFGWVGHIPGLGDDGAGGRIARTAIALGQIIVTPSDITIAEPQPNDAPWAGVLGLATSWSSYDNRRLAAMQAYLGCMGPCSGAEEVQTFVHEDLGFGDTPVGWDNQLDTKILGNLNYEYRYKLLADGAEDYAVGRFGNDFAVGARADLGNLITGLLGQIEYRFGWGLPMGFTKAPDPPGIGVLHDPVYFDPTAPLPSNLKGWRVYFTVVGRLVWIDRLAPAEGGDTVNGGTHPGVADIPGSQQLLVGLHFGRLPVNFHLTYYRYFDEPNIAGDASTDWTNFTLEYRF